MEISLGDKHFELIFRRLFERYFCALKSHAHHYTGSSAIAEDIVQDTFVQLWEIRESFDFDRSVKTWLYQSVQSKCINYLKHLQVENKYQNSIELKIHEAELYHQVLSDTQPDVYTDEAFYNQLKKAVAALPDRCRMAFILSRESGLSYKQIADEMQITVKAVEHHITRALNFLRASLRDYFIIWLVISLFI